MVNKDLVIIGGGPAGLAAAISAYEAGIKDIVVVEREKRLGGILRQCIHDGFGLHKFNKAYTGPEYAHKYVEKIKKLDIELLRETIAIDLTSQKIVTLMNKNEGLFKIRAGAVVLAMGSRERPAGSIQLAGKRPSGIYTAGVVQNLINLNNIMVGKKAVILGSGDIGLIMARRLTLEGASVESVLEIMPYTSGLPRNINQCLKDYDIPLKLNHTVVKVIGDKRVEAVVTAEVDENLNPIPESKKTIECDTLILSVGLIPENELSKSAGVQIDDVTGGALVKDNFETNVDGIFSAGNVLHIHDVVDYVSDEAEKAGKSAAQYIKNEDQKERSYTYLNPKKGINSVLPQLAKLEKNEEISLRVAKPSYNSKVIFKNRRKVMLEKSFRALHPSQMKKIVLEEKIDNEDIETLEVVVE